MARTKKKPKAGHRQRRPAMTAEEAQKFEKYSVGNAVTLAEAAAERGCACEPYEDWFTLRRWNALGYLVKRGEHGTALMVGVTKPAKNEGDPPETKFVRSYVFCRCQVQQNPEREEAHATERSALR